MMFNLWSCAIKGKGALSVGHFSCEEGYYLEGKGSIECNVFGQWESDLPICRCKLLSFSNPDV